MSGYVIKKNVGGAYVADMRASPEGCSYTNNLTRARRFSRLDLAKADLCVADEHVARVEDELMPIVA